MTQKDTDDEVKFDVLDTLLDDYDKVDIARQEIAKRIGEQVKKLYGIRYFTSIEVNRNPWRVVYTYYPEDNKHEEQTRILENPSSKEEKRLRRALSAGVFINA